MASYPGQGASRGEGWPPSQGLQRRHGCEDALSCFNIFGLQYQSLKGLCTGSLIMVRMGSRPYVRHGLCLTPFLPHTPQCGFEVLGKAWRVEDGRGQHLLPQAAS